MSRRPNHLEGQTSPYLLQHLYNPVDWHPWGDQALEQARREDKPIFLSIGYAACHWCHVMERESFEDAGVAALLNEHFVPIKVDREERPDLDEIYMTAVQLMTGSGGWPLNVFLTPDLRPFTGGTYFPPQARYGMIGFSELLQRVREAWASQRDRLDRSADQLTEQLGRIGQGLADAAPAGTVGLKEATAAVAELTSRFDPRWGGFGGAPKFPADGSLTLLLREHARTGERVPLQMVERTLESMARGGIYDQIGGGFARYSVDERWLVPHFEKMLYNQALLVPVYLDAWRVTGRELFRRVAEETLDFVRRELTDAAGGFHSSLDADSEGHEGLFYVWTPDEIAAELGADDARLFEQVFGITPEGNFEGKNVPHLLDGADEERIARLAPLRRRLLAARQRRVRPGTDDKVLTAWNGLMISAFARGYQALGRVEDLTSARRAADFVLAELVRDGRLRVSYREGRAALNGYLDDYAFAGRGLLDLYEACFEPRFIEAAATLAETMVRHFEDRERGGFFFVSDDHEKILARNRSLHDGALPSGAAIAVELLLRLGLHLDDDRLREPARRCLASYQPIVGRAPSAFAYLLAAADWAAAPIVEVAIVGDPDDPETSSLLRVVREKFRPRLAVALARSEREPGRLALLRGKGPVDGRPTAYVCHGYACRKPTSDPDALAALLG